MALTTVPGLRSPPRSSMGACTTTLRPPLASWGRQAVIIIIRRKNKTMVVTCGSWW